VDTVVEFVIEDYGMRSKKGHAGAYLTGYGRMFRLDGRSELWRRPFEADQIEQDAPHLDPFKVGKDPDLFRQAISSLLDGVAEQFVQDLTPKDRRGGPPPLPEGAEQAAPDSTNRTGRENQPRPPKPKPDPELPAGELPDPDPEPHPQ
jgi:hypothetical protein